MNNGDFCQGRYNVLDETLEVLVYRRVFSIAFEHEIQPFHSRIVVWVGFDSLLLNIGKDRLRQKISHAEISQQIDNRVSNPKVELGFS